jgi:hypothetical protein
MSDQEERHDLQEPEEYAPPVRRKRFEEYDVAEKRQEEEAA